MRTSYRPGGRCDDMAPADGNSTRGGSTGISVRLRVRSVAGQLQANRRTYGSRYRLMPPPPYGGCIYSGVSCKKKNRNAKNMASAGARAYMGVWGLCPQRGPGAEPMVRGLGGKLKAFYCRREQICHSHLSET